MKTTEITPAQYAKIQNEENPVFMKARPLYLSFEEFCITKDIQKIFQSVSGEYENIPGYNPPFKTTDNPFNDIDDALLIFARKEIANYPILFMKLNFRDTTVFYRFIYNAFMYLRGLIRELTNHYPDYIAVEYGFNDLRNYYRELNKPNFGYDYSVVLDRINNELLDYHIEIGIIDEPDEFEYITPEMLYEYEGL